MAATAAEWADYPYEASDEASESELLDRSLSVWRGRTAYDEDFVPIPLDLHTAASIGQFNTVRSIIDRGEEDVNKRNKGGWTAIMYACYIGFDDVVSVLIETGANVNVRNHKGQSPLMLAASCGNKNVGFYLIQAGAELEGQDKRGWTALFHATHSGHQNMVDFLLDSGGNMDAKEPVNEYTPLMEAAAAGHEIIVQCFLQHGVNVNQKACNGDTARSLALIYGHMKIVSLIDNHIIGHAHPLRSEAGLHAEDLSSSDEAYQHPRHHPPNPRGNRSRGKGHSGPSILDGPKEIAQRMQTVKTAPAQQAALPMALPVESDPIRARDVTSPIDPEDHSSSQLDSSGGRESIENEEDRNAFSQTGALTIKSSSSSSGGLLTALGLSRENSVDSTEDGATNTSREIHSDPGQMSIMSANPNDENSRISHSAAQNSKRCLSEERALPAGRTKTKLFENIELGGFGPHDGNDHQMAAGELTPKARQEQIKVMGQRARDLSGLMESLNLAKYMAVFDEQDVDLQVFLSLTDNDLQEIGIKKFGPRRKMTSAIARWHSNAKPCGEDLEQAYADKLEAEMQEMAIQLQKTRAQMEQSKAQILQEQELRSVTEACLMEDRQAWQQVNRIATDTRQLCSDMAQILYTTRQIQEEVEKRHNLDLDHNPMAHQNENSLVTALQEGLSLDDRGQDTANDISKIPTLQLVKRTQKLHEDLRRMVTIATINTDKLLGREIDYTNMSEGYS